MPKQTELRKQISIFLPISDWRLLRQAAAERQIPITELCREWIRPGLEQLQFETSPQRST
ncbi:hypothetical protein KOR42_16750 [Thalassoglobus neptunius]|uniref:CopG-like ribbon-helix-helix domain-containing protein n=1 Tax=Thalassoglobus neptunius TaxID=1938619 RepID=A0A5C5X7H6_9PLAN|nr:hypothetical protein [Thalassoglobus neptunius]TWT58301.1 hypothetical protein KOR42_16750 [Thalassoglobus neptunius]